MKLDRGIVIFGALVSLIIILTIALATIVYSEAPYRVHGPGDNSPTPGMLGGSPVADNSTDGMILGLGSTTNSIIGMWQDPSGNLYLFDSSACVYNLDMSTRVSYYAHQERVFTPSNTPVTTTVYSLSDDPEEGFAFLNGDLRFVVKGITRWEFWYPLTRADPILGTWRNAYYASKGDEFRITFDSTGFYDYYEGRRQIQPGIPYCKINAWVRAYDYGGSETYTDYNMTIYRVYVDVDSPSVTLRGYAFINGKLYDLRSGNNPDILYTDLRYLEYMRC